MEEVRARCHIFVTNCRDVSPVLRPHGASRGRRRNHMQHYSSPSSRDSQKGTYRICSSAICSTQVQLLQRL